LFIRYVETGFEPVSTRVLWRWLSNINERVKGKAQSISLDIFSPICQNTISLLIVDSLTKNFGIF